MEKQRILIVFGTRPEAIKLFPVVKALAGHPGIDVKTCVTAQHRGLLDQVLEIADIQPDFDLDIMAPGQTLDGVTAKLLVRVGQILDAEHFDRVIVHGDTATAMCSSLAAYYRKVPVGHVEAGLRSGDIYHPWPEEIYRRIIAPIADLHFAPTQIAAEALHNEGVRTGVYVTGNTVIDALHATLGAIEKNPALASAFAPLQQRMSHRRLLLVTTHRRENFGRGMEHIATAIAAIAQRKDVHILFPVHPNPGVRSIMHKTLARHANITLTDSLDYPCFVSALSRAHMVLTDSGGVQEEAPALGKPVLIMRKTTERPEGLTAGTARLVGTLADTIVTEVNALLDDPKAYAAMARAHNPFGDGRAAQRIAAILASPHADADPVSRPYESQSLENAVKRADAVITPVNVGQPL